MKTREEQKAFFDSYWPAMKEAVETGGGKAVVEMIQGFSDDLERRVLYVFARQGLSMGDWAGKSFDAYIEVCDAGIAEMLRQAETAPDEETARQRVNGAHVISFNLAADLADCWPGDEAERTRTHFERGLRAAEDCLRWCAPEITTGFANDHWVKGMHQISLGDHVGAAESFERSEAYAAKAAEEQDAPPSGAFGAILASGYGGLARWLAEQPSGQRQYEEAIEAFRAQLTDEEKREDAEFGLAQLETVRERYLS